MQRFASQKAQQEEVLKLAQMKKIMADQMGMLMCQLERAMQMLGALQSSQRKYKDFGSHQLEASPVLLYEKIIGQVMALSAFQMQLKGAPNDKLIFSLGSDVQRLFELLPPSTKNQNQGPYELIQYCLNCLNKNQF